MSIGNSKSPGNDDLHHNLLMLQDNWFLKKKHIDGNITFITVLTCTMRQTTKYFKLDRGHVSQFGLSFFLAL